MILRQRERQDCGMNIRLIKRFLLILAAIGAACLVFALGYISFVIGSTPIDSVLTQVVPGKQYQYPGGNLEEGATVKQSSLETYLAFSTATKSPQEYIEFLKKEGVLDPYGQVYFEVNEDIALPDIRGNNCERVFCFQRKLPFQNIPRVFWKGLIGIEDNRFVHHFGIDLRSIARALFKDILAMRFVEGGSTITQQLVKNMFYSNERSIIRKINEMILAVYIESNYPKEQILEAYFNEIVWGSLQGIRIKGIGAASIFYFGKNIEFLKPYEATILISLLKGPYYYQPIRHTERLKTRVEAVFKRLLELNFFSKKDQLEWADEDWKKWISWLEEREKARDFYTIWKTFSAGDIDKDFYQKYVLHDKVKDVLLSIPTEVRTKHQIESKLIISNWNGENFQTYYQLYSNLERDKTKALAEEKHQLGSILKPLIYRLILSPEQGLNSLVTTEPVHLKLKSGVWSPSESHKIITSDIPIKEALQRSYNNPLIRLSSDYGFDQLEVKLKEYIPEIQTPLSEYPAQLLGAVELPLTRVAEVYAKFLKQSCYGKDSLGGEILREMADPTITTISKSTLRQFRDMRFFGKTGTSNNGNHNWFIGFDGRSLYVLWVGASGVKSKDPLKLYGSTTAFRIFQNYLVERGKTFQVFDCLEDDPLQI